MISFYEPADSEDINTTNLVHKNSKLRLTPKMTTNRRVNSRWKAQIYDTLMPTNSQIIRHTRRFVRETTREVPKQNSTNYHISTRVK